MVFKLAVLALLFPTLFLTGSVMDNNARHSKSPAPSWVKHHNFPLEAVPIKPFQVNLQTLLIDTQRNLQEKTAYYHFVYKVLTQSGVQEASQLSLDFDPTYTQVVMHAMRVYRAGEWLDRLATSRHNVLQREKDLENDLYCGTLTLVYFIDDIREGDIVEYSFSYVGCNPLFASHFTGTLSLQTCDLVEKISHRILGRSDLFLQIRPINTTIKPSVSDISPSLREWEWEIKEALPYSYESDEPAWYNSNARVEVSQYKNWGEVAQKLCPLYELPQDLAQSMPAEMRSVVEKWKVSTKSAAGRALLALRFVQDEVRYLGFEEGMGAFQPTHPSITFQRRFGDCKDKTFLLHALLHLMDIPSTPLLVHTSKGKKLPEILPIPNAFDHIVLRLEAEGNTYWVDPTMSLQGGSLKTNFFPNYEWGFLVAKDTDALTPLPKPIFKNPTEIDTSITLESEDSGHMKIKSTFYGPRADQMRQLVKWNGLKAVSQSSLSDMQKAYGGATVAAPMDIVDNRERNIFILNESYRIPTRVDSNRKTLEVYSYTFRNYFHCGINPERSTPCAIPYPHWIKEHIHFDNPFTFWDVFENKSVQEHESFFFTSTARSQGIGADFDFELKHLKDHIPQSSIREYWKKINDIYKEAPGAMNIVIFSDTERELIHSIKANLKN